MKKKPAKPAAKKTAAKKAASLTPHAAFAAAHALSGHGSSNAHSKPAIKQFIQSPNRSSRNGAVIDQIVVHCTEASLASTIATFQDGRPKSQGGRQVSAHYVINRNGDIYQMVSDSERANHCVGANQKSIGIEHVGLKTDSMSAAQTIATVALMNWLKEQYDVPRSRIFGHDFSPDYTGGGTSCPDKLFGGAHTQQQVQTWLAANGVNAP
ncbi:MAG: N-acetylmuramoyl-L-alanine amidase [Verrucomicrobiaceae bacterium]|nr:N-acetylmuramoyl-L-alanine amidase [Verrucomicrobiaceae bacterium]